VSLYGRVLSGAIPGIIVIYPRFYWELPLSCASLGITVVLHLPIIHSLHFDAVLQPASLHFVAANLFIALLCSRDEFSNDQSQYAVFTTMGIM